MPVIDINDRAHLQWFTQMLVSLEDFTSQSIELIPTVPCKCRVPGAGRSRNHLVFSAENLPSPSNILTTPKLAIGATEHHYDSSIRIDTLHFYAAPTTYRQLGVLLLACIFHLHEQVVVINLTNPHSKLKHVEIDYKGLTHGAAWGYVKRPLRFTYHPQFAQPRPDWPQHEHYLPQFSYTFSRENKSHPVEDLDKRDSLVISGEDEGLILLAELLLNVGLVNNNTPLEAIELEGFPGHRRVRTWSAEAQFHLPGSSSWPGDYPELPE
jgi:hypothetical protein